MRCGIGGKLVTKNRYLVDQTKLFKVDEGSASPPDSRDRSSCWPSRFSPPPTGRRRSSSPTSATALITAGLLDRILPPLRQRGADPHGRRERPAEQPAAVPRRRSALPDRARSARNAARFLQRPRRGRLRTCCTRPKPARRSSRSASRAWSRSISRYSAQSDDRLRSEYLPALARIRSIRSARGCAVAAASLTLAVGGSLQAAALLGSMAAAIEVQSIGNVPIKLDRLAEKTQQEYQLAATRMAG